MLPSRPKINLLLPRVIRPGASFEAEVLLDAKSELQLDELKATLTGSERVSTGESGAKLEVLAMYATLGKEITLPRGRSVYRCRFALPQDLPASYQGKRCTIDYMMQVHAAVPWWLDRKEQFVVKLQPPRGDEHSTIDDPGPSLHSSHPQGAASEEPQVEFSLNTTLLKPSDTLSGSLALFNVESNRYRRVTLSLVANEQLRNADGGALNAAEASRYSLRFDLRAPQEGAASSWRMKAPETLAPSFQSALCSLSWSFEVFVETWWGSDISLMVPLRVAAKDARLRKPSKQRAIPTVGSDRILTIWRAVAKEHELILADHALTKEVGEVAVNVSREHHANLGVFLTGRLSYPNLNLELDGGERKGLQRFVREGIDVGDERWGRRHYFAGRDPEQVASFFHALRDLKRYQLLDIDDELLVVATLDAGQSLARLSRFVAEVFVLLGRREQW